MPEHEAIISLGSNIDPEKHIDEALKELGYHFTILKKSRFFFTEPLLFENQSKFLNGAVLLKTESERNELKAELKKIESRMGRVHTSNKNGPRIIDLDILLFDGEIVDTDYYSRDFLQQFVRELRSAEL